MSKNSAGRSLEGRVLLVEDEALVRMDIADELRRVGFPVIEAASGDEAMRFVETGVAFDLLFTDIRMPGRLDGVSLAQNVRARLPEVPIVFASAHRLVSDSKLHEG